MGLWVAQSGVSGAPGTCLLFCGAVLPGFTCAGAGRALSLPDSSVRSSQSVDCWRKAAFPK